MQFPDSDTFLNYKGKAFQGTSSQPLYVTRNSRSWLNRITHRWSIYQKIVYGYVLAISIAVLGTGVGLLVGEYFDNKAANEFSESQETYELMEHLEQSILGINFYQQRLVLVLNKNKHQQDEISKFIERIHTTRKCLIKLRYNLKNEPIFSGDYSVKLKIWLQTYDTDLKSYTLLLQSLLQKIKTENLTAKDIQAAQRVLGMTSDGEIVPVSESLEQLVKSNLERRQQATATLQAAKVLRAIIIVASMVLSMAIALALAVYTSRAIARPIQAVTNVAKQVTQDSNFDLQAPVTTEDEVGVLATSLNQLIHQVAIYIRELKQAQAHLIQSEKMSSLGQMVAGVAHEINNPVNFIYGNLNYANDYLQELLELMHLYQHSYPYPEAEVSDKIEEIDLDFISEDLPKMLSSMHSGAERIREIILSLRKFCYLDESEIKKVDIHEGINNTLLILSYQLNQGIEVIKHYNYLPLVACYPAQLNQLFLNIISNAIHELLTAQTISHKQILIQTKLVNNNEIEVRIRDSGPGIAPEIQHKIFDPFFTTKQVGQGTGMGLAICYQIVEKHQGTIEIFSELNQGAEFVITLPVEQSYSTDTNTFSNLFP
jgi:two-component system, NtrC family, sensor kinase